jgi:hypothetical protein
MSETVAALQSIRLSLVAKKLEKGAILNSYSITWPSSQELVHMNSPKVEEKEEAPSDRSKVLLSSSGASKLQVTCSLKFKSNSKLDVALC